MVMIVLVMRAVKKILFLYFTSSTMIMKLSWLASTWIGAIRQTAVSAKD